MTKKNKFVCVLEKIVLDHPLKGLLGFVMVWIMVIWTVKKMGM